MHRVVIVSDTYDGIPAALVNSALAALGRRRDVRIVALCLPTQPRYLSKLLFYYLRRVLRAARGLSRGRNSAGELPARPRDLRRLAARHGFPVLVPPSGDINEATFIARLEREFAPTTLVNLYGLQLFREPLLGLFRDAINYHNGDLPAYRGLKATAWSVYKGDRESGYLFHRLTPGLDEGPILARGSLPIDAESRTRDLEWRKARSAAGLLDRVFDRLEAGDPGDPQEGEGAYYSRRDLNAIKTVGDAGRFTAAELERRLRAFEALELLVAGHPLRVTQLRRLAGPVPGRLPVITAADGVRLVVTRVDHLPYGLYRIAARLGVL